jgi:hypothetical protein
MMLQVLREIVTNMPDNAHLFSWLEGDSVRNPIPASFALQEDCLFLALTDRLLARIQEKWLRDVYHAERGLRGQDVRLARPVGVQAWQGEMCHGMPWLRWAVTVAQRFLVCHPVTGAAVTPIQPFVAATHLWFPIPPEIVQAVAYAKQISLRECGCQNELF